MSKTNAPKGFIRREITCPICIQDHLWQKAYYPQLFCDNCQKIVGVLGPELRAPQHAASDTPAFQSRNIDYF